MSETYQKLDELPGNKKEAAKRSKYCEIALKRADWARSSLKEAKQKKVYYACENARLNTNATGSFHAQVIDEVGAKILL